MKLPVKSKKHVAITLTPDDHLENMPSFNRPAICRHCSPVLSKAEPECDHKEKVAKDEPKR